jgi:hypothetical protein
MDNKRLVDKLLEASNKIFKPRRGSGNYIIINSVYRRFIDGLSEWQKLKKYLPEKHRNN